MNLATSIEYIGAPDIQMIFNRERFVPEGFEENSIIKESTIVNAQFDSKLPTFMDWHIEQFSLEDEVSYFDPFWSKLTNSM